MKSALVIFLILAMSLMTLPAATVTWDGGAGSNNWEDANNWSTDTLPDTADTAQINSSNSVEFQSSDTITNLRLGASNGSQYGEIKIVSVNLLVTGGYNESSGNIWVAGGNLAVGTSTTTTSFNNQFAKRSGSSDTLRVTGGIYAATSRFGPQGQNGNWTTEISGNGKVYITGHSVNWGSTTSLASQTTILSVTDHGVLEVGNTSFGIGFGGAGNMTITMSGCVMSFVKDVTIGSVSGNTNFYHSSGNIEFGNTLSFGDSADDGPHLYEISGAGNLQVGNDIDLESDATVFRVYGSQCNISIADRLQFPTGNPTLAYTPSTSGISPIQTKDLYLNGRGTLDVDTSSFSGAKTLTLIRYTGTRNTGTGSGVFASVNISGYRLGSDPSGNPENLERGEYYLDYGSGSNSAVTLYYNSPWGSVLFIE